MLVIAADISQAVHRFIEGIEGKDTGSGIQPLRKPGLLRDDRPSTGEVGCTAFAEPAAVTHHIAVFGDRELTFG